MDSQLKIVSRLIQKNSLGGSPIMERRGGMEGGKGFQYMNAA